MHKLLSWYWLADRVIGDDVDIIHRSHCAVNVICSHLHIILWNCGFLLLLFGVFLVGWFDWVCLGFFSVVCLFV